MSYVHYVIFREDPVTHGEAYTGVDTPVYDVADALHFETARAAYDFAGAIGLENWRVGQR
jgi:hypothetical protein